MPFGFNQDPERRAFAFYRRAKSSDALPGDREAALNLLRVVEDEQGPSSETYGLIGRVQRTCGKNCENRIPKGARGHSKRPLQAYSRGF